jgi:transposase
VQKFKLLASGMDKDLIIQLQQHQIKEQAKMIMLLEARITELENNQKKNSSNSSKPPSSDIGKPNRTQSLRTRSDKKRGGQQGHTGETLNFSTTPDEIVRHTLETCACCGKNLKHIEADSIERRQVYDIPPISIKITEYQSEVKSCPKCATVNKAPFPVGISQPVQYGERFQAIASYFTHYQLLPLKRTSQMFQDLFGHAPSQAFLVNNNHRLAKQLQPFDEWLKSMLLQQPVLHADETGFYYNSKRNWLHTLCNEQYTLYMPHARRGSEAMDAMGVLADFTGTLVHDFWKSYNDYNCKHALCNVHHLRDLTFCEEVLGCSWAKDTKQFLLDLHEKVKATKQAGGEQLNKGQWQYWRRKFERLLEEGNAKYPPPEKVEGRRGVVAKSKPHNLLERFSNYDNEILGFAKNFNIPFGNNQAEQDIRMMKLKQKISGCFRSEQGAKDFATIRSYIATIQKHGLSIIQAIQDAVIGSPMLLQA